jgi:hypothetical protein
MPASRPALRVLLGPSTAALIAKVAVTASPIVLLLGKRSSIGRKTILVWEIIFGELVHHLGILRSRLIICTHRTESVEVFKAAIHSALPPIPITAPEVHHVHGVHVIHSWHGHVSPKSAEHAVRHIGHIHVLEIWTILSEIAHTRTQVHSTYP